MHYIQPDWPAPPSIHAFTTTRKLKNLATHVNDDPQAVQENRIQLCQTLQLPEMPTWLKQTHSNHAIPLTKNAAPAPAPEQEQEQEADASYTQQANTVCAILTADCLPILLCNKEGTKVAAIHAGWRGLYHGIIASTLQSLQCEPETLFAWLGPAISADHYCVGESLRTQFLRQAAEFEPAFYPNHSSWNLDLYQLATIQLQSAGIQQIYGGNYCTYRQNDLFYSYRRDGQSSGRIATLIWISAT